MIEEPAAEIVNNSKNINERELFSEIVKNISIGDISDEAVTLAKKYGYLEYMVQRYIDMLKYEDALKLLKSFEDYRYRPTILCNTLKIQCSELVDRLMMLGFRLEPIHWCNYSYIVTKHATRPSLGSTHEYLKGLYYVYRDASSLLPVLALAPIPGSSVLDMCAAPGGKSVHILLRLEDNGFLVANDISVTRLRALIVNMFRMGFKSYIVISEDGSILPNKVNTRFDYVLLDAPCSAEGAIMFDKSRKIKTSQIDLAKLVLREIMLLISAIRMTKHGGRIVYATCSIAPEENEYVITKVMELINEEIEIEDIALGIGDEGLKSFRDLRFHQKISKCIRIWPHKHYMEGYFVCVIRKWL